MKKRLSVSSLSERLQALSERLKNIDLREPLVRLKVRLVEWAREMTATRVVTVDLDGTAVRLMESKGKRVLRWASASLEVGEARDGGRPREKVLGAKIKELMKSCGIKGGKMIASLPGLYSMCRIITVPNPAAGVGTQQALIDAAREELPLPPERLYLFWTVIGTSDDGQRAYVVAIPRESLDTEIRTLRAAGIKPRLMELKGMSLVRAVNREQAVILNIESESFDVIVLAHRTPEIMRTVPWERARLTPEEQIENLVVNLELTVGFYDSHHTDSPLGPTSPLFVTGSLAEEPTLVEGLQARLKHPVEALVPLLELPPLLPGAQYATNIGLALKPSTPAKGGGQAQAALQPLDMNLLPEAYRPWRPTAKQMYVTGILIVALGLLFPLFRVTTDAMNKSADLQARYSVLNNELTRRQTEIKNRQPMQKAVDEYNLITSARVDFAGDVAVIFREGEKLGISVEDVAHEGDKISVAVKAKEGDYVTFRKYIKALEDSGRFASPIPPPEGFPYTWQGTITLKPKPPAK